LSQEARALVSFGANLGEPARQIKEAVARLRENKKLRYLKASSFYLTEPVGPVSQPPFVNAVAEWATELSPGDVLEILLGVEQEMGRERSLRWGPRAIDLDLLLFSDRIVDVPGLDVPHPRMHERRFILEPLAEVAPEAVDPRTGQSAAELLAALPGGGPWVKLLDEAWE
jgi:2-amino-4-hydroxy-6-hydroxymethyldihydropteridine diphosphokinase